MPGPFIHISSMKHTAAQLGNARRPFIPAAGPLGRVNPEWGTKNKQSMTDLGQLMLKWPNFASLGAIGPDLFFFLPDFRNKDGIPISSMLVTILNALEGLYGVMDPYISKYEKYLGPISEDTAEEMSRLTGGLSETVGNISGELSGILITFLESLITEQADFFGYFSLGLDVGYDEQAFLWSDMLHYRDTGQFSRAIWKRADDLGDEQLKAYALGYQTHVATDVTGHAFVNVISGGPFRMHWQRHHLVENHMDASWYAEDPIGPKNGDQYPQLTESAIYYDIAFGDGGMPIMRPTYPTGDTLRENWERKRLLDQDSTLPLNVAQLLLDAMTDIWYSKNPATGMHPKILSEDGRPDPQLVQETYDLFYRYLKLVTVDGFNHDPPPPPDVFPNLQFPTISDPGSGGSAPGDGTDDGNFWDDVLDFFLALIRDIEYVIEVAVYLATLPWAVLADLVTYPLRLGLYYALELPLFNLLKSFRQALVMTGYLLPMDDEVSPFLIRIGASSASGFADLLNSIGDVFGGTLPGPALGPPVSFRDLEYPHSIPVDGSSPPAANEYKAPWKYPMSPVELHNVNLTSEAAPQNPILNSQQTYATTGGPYALMAAPNILFGAANQDPAIRERFEAAQTPGDADVVGMDVTPTSHLGDCVAFSKYYIWLESRDPAQRGVAQSVVEWNLDADMGYGYHAWDWNRRDDVTQKDPNDHQYREPCTLPEQSDAFPAGTGWQPTTRLQIHWVGPDPAGDAPLPDPGCAPAPDNPRAPRGKKKALARGKRRRRA
jgi:hypothetical protein